jgi:hypothetical protein
MPDPMPDPRLGHHSDPTTESFDPRVTTNFFFFFFLMKKMRLFESCWDMHDHNLIHGHLQITSCTLNVQAIYIGG